MPSGLQKTSARMMWLPVDWALAETFAEAARKDLGAFEPSPYRDALEALPGFILARDH